MPRLWIAGLAVISVSTHGADRSRQGWSSLSLAPALGVLLSSGDFGSTPKGFRIVALSFLADGCVAEARRDSSKREAARACVHRALELAKHTRRQPISLEREDGLWLSHFNLILGAADAMGPCADLEQHRAVSEALRKRSLDDAFHHVRSYANLAHRWPADQTATLASLHRHDAAHGTDWSADATQPWRAYVLEHAMDKKFGLPWSEVTLADKTSKLPRGCALSWQTRYLNEVDPKLARTWWEAFRGQYWVEHLGMGGLREWPPGVEHKGDIDSGPIVQGVGAAATALGIAAARVMGDERSAAALERTALLVGSVSRWVPQARGPLPEAIRYVGEQIRPPAHTGSSQTPALSLPGVGR